MANCFCGAPDCWPENDSAWLASNSGWHGEKNGCETSIFFIHGKKIREQRYIPEGSYQLADLLEFLKRWGYGLEDARLVWIRDAGDSDAGLWIEGTREPDDLDTQRLAETREQMRRLAKDDIKWKIKQFPGLINDLIEEV